MTDALAEIQKLESQLEEAQELARQSGDQVRALKAALKEGTALQPDVDAAIQSLAQAKKSLEAKQQALEKLTGKPNNPEAYREALWGMLQGRLFFIPSFKIYGSVSGFYDYGPPGCAVKQNIQQLWRQHFILEEGMLELECPAVTPHPVLKASGHVDRFTDFMVRDMVTQDCHRADHLLEDALEAAIKEAAAAPAKKKELEDQLARVGEMKGPELGKHLEGLGIKAPGTGNDLSEPFTFNLMFKTSIGPKGDVVGYLRPETAQGIFVNFANLLYYNGGKLPFAGAQIGQSYRNEISPKSGLIRVREFTQAEIEHFCHPQKKDHPKFKSVASLTPMLYSAQLQTGDTKKAQPMALGEAVSGGIIANETLGYFIGRTYLFLTKVGLNPNRVRFRQHLPHEMAHYAEDCWDAEVDCSFGWVECVGLADRSAFDLKAHMAASKTDLVAYEKFDTPQMVEELAIRPNRKVLGQSYKKDAKPIVAHLEAMCEGDALDMKAKLDAGESVQVDVDGQKFDISPDMVEIAMETTKKSGQRFIPSVIEPSFGIGRILYCLLEHSYTQREGGSDEESRNYLSFKPIVAPIKATVFPLMQKPELVDVCTRIVQMVTRAGLSNITDTSGATIGKRYARTDEIGVPYAITVDYDTLKNETVTLRERDSMAQVRVPQKEVANVLRQLTDEDITWEGVQQTYPKQDGGNDGEAAG